MSRQEAHKGKECRDMSGEQKTFQLPAKVIVSLRAGFVLALANIVCVSIVSYAWTKSKAPQKSIQVTGSAKRQITSDLIVWTGTVTNSDPDLATAFNKLKDSTSKTVAYLRAHGVPAAEIETSSIATRKIMRRDEKGNPTDVLALYELSQSVTVSSGDVGRVSEIARNVTEIIQQGVLIESAAPRYLYTKLADLKIQMLAEATRDATTRADKIASNSGASLGSIIEAHMGVMQINALHENEASSSGVNDTTSVEKEITAIVTASFTIK
jgi:hypothetical protein